LLFLSRAISCPYLFLAYLTYICVSILTFFPLDFFMLFYFLLRYIFASLFSVPLLSCRQSLIISCFFFLETWRYNLSVMYLTVIHYIVALFFACLFIPLQKVEHYLRVYCCAERAFFSVYFLGDALGCTGPAAHAVSSLLLLLPAEGLFLLLSLHQRERVQQRLCVCRMLCLRYVLDCIGLVCLFL
jgi:hypothetical protein